MWPNRCMMLKNFLRKGSPPASTSCKKQIGLSFIDVFLKCQATLDWSLFHKNHDILTISCSGKDFDILKPWNFSDFKNLKN